MSSPTIAALRSVALNMPDLAKAETFYTQVWHLSVVAREENAIYLRGTGADHHLLSLHAGGDKPQIRHVTFRARSEAALADIEKHTVAAGGSIAQPLGALQDPAGGTGLTVRDQDGRLIQVVFGDKRHGDAGETKDQPMRLAHVVLNAHDIPKSQKFFEQALGFRLIDRTKIMAFMNCNADHHSLALGDSDTFGVVIEYTADVQQVDDSYKVGMPEDWKWPAGRVDHWGISAPPSARLKEAQRAVLFAPSQA